MEHWSKLVFTSQLLIGARPSAKKKKKIHWKVIQCLSKYLLYRLADCIVSNRNAYPEIASMLRIFSIGNLQIVKHQSSNGLCYNEARGDFPRWDGGNEEGSLLLKDLILLLI